MRLIRIPVGETQFTFFKGPEHLLAIFILTFTLSVDFYILSFHADSRVYG